MNDRTILCRLSWFLSGCIRKLLGKVDFGGWIKVKVDSSNVTTASTLFGRTECSPQLGTYRAGIIPTKLGPKPL